MSDQMIRESLSYNPETGAMTWLQRPVHHFANERIAKAWNTRRAGTESRRLTTNGYLSVQVGRRQLLAHRVAWFLHHGAWPKGDLDHRNRIRTDNRITNLREATRSQNMINSKRKVSSSGIKGVYWCAICNKWKASIKINKKLKHLGLFLDPEDARAARLNAEQIHYGEFR